MHTHQTNYKHTSVASWEDSRVFYFLFSTYFTFFFKNFEIVAIRIAQVIQSQSFPAEICNHEFISQLAFIEHNLYAEHSPTG